MRHRTLRKGGKKLTCWWSVPRCCCWWFPPKWNVRCWWLCRRRCALIYYFNSTYQINQLLNNVNIYWNKIKISKNQIKKRLTRWHAAKKHVENILGAHVVLVEMTALATVVMTWAILDLGTFSTISLVVCAFVFVGQDWEGLVDDLKKV